MLTIAYIANGKSTNRYHLPFSLKNENIRVKTIYSRRDNSVWEKIPEVHYVHDLNQIWLDEEIQLVVICTPEEHYEYAKLALEKGNLINIISK